MSEVPGLSEIGKKKEIDSRWKIVVPDPGERTRMLIESEPKIGNLKPVTIYEYLVEGSDMGIVCIPGGLDRKTDNETMEMGVELGESTFQIKYPSDSSFSIRREVSQVLDYIKSVGVKRVKFVTGSWGGIPTMNAAYNILKDESMEVESIFMVAGALQPHDLAPLVREVAGNVGKVVMEISAPIPGRQLLSRVSKTVPDFNYDEPEVLAKVAKVPTVLLIPPGGKDWWVSARGSYDKIFPKATIIEYPAYANFAEKVATMGGHDSKNAIRGIRQIEKAFLTDPNAKVMIPQDFVLIK